MCVCASSHNYYSEYIPTTTTTPTLNVKSEASVALVDDKKHTNNMIGTQIHHIVSKLCKSQLLKITALGKICKSNLIHLI